MQKFRDVLSRWDAGELSMMEAVELLGVSERQFRRYRDRYEEDGVEEFVTGRLGKPSPKRVPAGVGEPRFKAFGERASPVPHRWVVINFIQTPVDRWAHTCFDRAVVASRPGLQSNLSAGTHLGVRNLAPKHLGRKETTWNYLQC
jgi:Winged helix-turn helix